ncbi:MAG: hypothetical protein ACI86M_003514 [Saprospiraceae bacterium]|jgi:hypothetical protein
MPRPQILLLAKSFFEVLGKMNMGSIVEKNSIS